jgi:hypothetical protein
MYEYDCYWLYEIVLNNNIKGYVNLTNVKNILYVVCVIWLQHLVSVQGNVKTTVTFGIKIKLQ